jgi:pimeloyl-ACP methyl ester carboxylesterase
MTVVLIHGNPETDAIWDLLRIELARDDVITLSPPGFGAPLPKNFDVTSDGYLHWLAQELEKLDGPIDLVGHDWGGVLVVRLAMTRPDLIRSWCTDIIGIFNHEYVWHDAAQSWQGPDGEAAVSALIDLSESDRRAIFAQLGMGESVATKVAPWVNDDMGQAILGVYRSVSQPAVGNLGEALHNAAARPGLCIIASEDTYTGGEMLHRQAAKRSGAEVAVLEGLGHWWMCEDPTRAAEQLNLWFDKQD